jgi:hypothetical protein
MNKIATIMILAAAILAGPGGSEGADKAGLAKKQDTLGAEYGLAKDAKFYFVFDVLGRKIELRARGMVLKTWPIREMRFWGRPEFAGTVELVKKTTLKAPERIVIKPGETEEIVKPAPVVATPAAPGSAAAAADYDLEAIELRDMPKRFGLDLDNGLHITVKAKNGEAPGLGVRMKEAWRWYIGLPLQDLVGKRGERGLAELELILENELDAQSIYWHLFDGIKGIIL